MLKLNREHTDLFIVVCSSLVLPLSLSLSYHRLFSFSKATTQKRHFPLTCKDFLSFSLPERPTDPRSSLPIDYT